MAEYCPSCFELMEFLHTCSANKHNSGNTSFQSHSDSNSDSLEKTIILAPLMGVVLDLVLPLPSSFVHSALVGILGSAVSGIAWVTFKHSGPKGLGFFAKNLKNFLFTPNMRKVFGEPSKNLTSAWLAVLAASVAIQLLVFTPGNATYLGNQVTKKIDNASGANLKTSCPSFKVYLYNEKIECRVKTGLFGISVPARAQLSPLLGTSEIKVSLL